MKPYPLIESLICAVLWSCLFAAAQDTQSPSTRTPEDAVEVVNLAQPIFPALARQANIVGDIDVLVIVAPDGTLQSAEVLRGHPMLKQAALDSATHSRFNCHNCKTPQQYLLLYSYKVVDDGDCCHGYAAKPIVEQLEAIRNAKGQLQTHVIIMAKQGCLCDPAFTVKVRSPRCLYLWKCGTRR